MGQALVFAALTGLLLLLWRLLSGSRRTAALVLREVLFLVAAALLYSLVRGLVADQALDAARRAWQIVRLEQVLGIFWEPALQSAVLPYKLLVDLANWVYIWWHWPAISLVMFWLFVRHRESYPLYRNTLLLSGAIGLLIFALFPVAPPRLMPDLGLVDTITRHSQSYRLFQPPSLTNQYAAVPSFHFGWNVLMAIALVRQGASWLPRALGLLAPPAMLLSIVLTGNHFIVDAVAGGALVLGTLLLVLGRDRWRAPRRPRLVGLSPGHG